VTALALSAMAEVPGVHVTRGKEVVEVAVTKASKGAAIGRLRDHLGAAAVLYLGDDVTDETVFELLGPHDVGVKVGDGQTAAGHRIADPAAVRDLLRALPTLLAPAGEAGS
jgi:trehalose-phosphatase